MTEALLPVGEDSELLLLQEGKRNTSVLVRQMGELKGRAVTALKASVLEPLSLPGFDFPETLSMVSSGAVAGWGADLVIDSLHRIRIHSAMGDLLEAGRRLRSAEKWNDSVRNIEKKVSDLYERPLNRLGSALKEVSKAVSQSHMQQAKSSLKCALRDWRKLKRLEVMGSEGREKVSAAARRAFDSVTTRRHEYKEAEKHVVELLKKPPKTAGVAIAAALVVGAAILCWYKSKNEKMASDVD